MKCTNNLKQIGISLHNYHDVHNSFPGSRMGNGTISTADWGVVSGFVALLPFSEQQQRYETMKYVGYRMYYKATDNPVIGEPWPNTGDMYPASVAEVPYLRCPSSPTFMKTQGFYGDSSTYLYKNNMLYATTTGGRPRNGVALTAEEKAGDFAETSRGVAETAYAYCVGDAIACTAEALSSDRGVFSSGKYKDNTVKIKGINSITDGTTNTLAFSEILNTNSFTVDPANSGSQQNLLYTQGFYGGYGNLSNTTLTVANCLATYDASTKQFVTGSYIVKGRYARGGRWTCGHTGMTGFNTVMPPNSPNCAAGGEGCSQAGFYNAQSAHPGGVNALRCDGSVIFVSSSIDCGNQNYYDPTVAAADWIAHQGSTVPPTEMLSGQSPYGVWGAMGTPAGGESKSL